MPKKTLTTLVACALLAIAVGCQQNFYASGIGGNLVPVKQDPDGTWLCIPSDPVDEYRQAEKAKLDDAPTVKR